MKIMPLQKNGVKASRLALGCMPLGGSWEAGAYTRESFLQAEKAVDAALSIGINMFDHADIYTRGKAESIFGELLRARPSLREQIVIQSKCGILLGDGTLPGRFDFSKSHILQSVDGSLSRLGVDYLDILLLHRPDPLVEPEQVAEALGELKASGKVRFFGVSNMSVAQIEFLQRSIPDKLLVNQLELNLLRSDFIDQTIYVNQKVGASTHFSDGLLEYMQINGIQIQSWGPLAQGKLSGRALDDQPEHVRRTADIVAKMAAEKETTTEAIVLGWLMKHPAMIQPVIGTTNAERIIACQDAERQSQLMTRDEWYVLYTAARQPH